MPRENDPNPNLVTVSGKDEDTVYDCIDYLRNMEEEYLQVGDLCFFLKIEMEFYVKMQCNMHH